MVGSLINGNAPLKNISATLERAILSSYRQKYFKSFIFIICYFSVEYISIGDGTCGNSYAYLRIGRSYDRDASGRDEIRGLAASS